MDNYQQPGQGQPQWQPQPPQKPNNSNNGFCIASMVIGICAVVFVCVPFLPIVLGIVGIVMAVMGLKTKGVMHVICADLYRDSDGKVLIYERMAYL